MLTANKTDTVSAYGQNPFVLVPSEQAINQTGQSILHNGNQFPQSANDMHSQQPKVFSTPVIVTENSSGISQTTEKEIVFADTDENCMFYTRISTSYHNRSSAEISTISYPYPEQVNNRHKEYRNSKAHRICRGVIRVRDSWLVRDEEQCTEQRVIRLEITDTQKNQHFLEIDADLPIKEPKEFKNQLCSCGIVFDPKGRVEYLAVYILNEEANIANRNNIVYQGYYQEGESLRSSSEEHIFRNAADFSELKNILNLSGRFDKEDFYNLTMFGIGCIARIRTLLKGVYIPLISFISLMPQSALKELSSIYCTEDTYVLKTAKDISLKFRDNVALLDLSGLTDYSVKKELYAVNLLINNDIKYQSGIPKITTTPVIITDNPDFLTVPLSVEQTVFISFRQSGIDSGAERAFCWFQKRCLDNSGFFEKLKDYVAHFNQDLAQVLGIQKYLLDLFSLLSAITALYCDCVGLTDNEKENISESYGDYLLNIFDNIYEIITDDVVEYIERTPEMLVPKNCLKLDDMRRNLIYYDNHSLLLTPTALSSMAQSLNTAPMSLAKQLKSIGILEATDKLQKSVRIGVNTRRMYSFSLDRLYRTGQVRIEPNDFSDVKPEINIPIGLCFGKQIYFSAVDRNGTENLNSFICGPSGSGKSFFLQKFANSAASQGIEVISIGTELSCLKLNPSESRIHISAEHLSVRFNFSMLIEPVIPNLETSEIDILLPFKRSKDTFSTLEQCMTELFGHLSEIPGGNLIKDKINSAFTCGIYQMSDPWYNICVAGKISTVICDDYSTEGMNKVIESLFRYKSSQSTVNPCLVIIDECQEFDLQQNSSLVRLLLRQGRKCGIMTFIATQYLTADNGRNISFALKQCGTLFAFKPGDDSKIIGMLGWRTKDAEKRSAMAEITRYSCVAKGNLSTSKCQVSYPLFIDIPK